MIKQNESLMYLGPTIRGVVKHGAIFTGKIPGTLDEFRKKKPIINNLIVPLSELLEAKKALSEEGTIEHVAFKQLEEQEGE